MEGRLVDLLSSLISHSKQEQSVLPLLLSILASRISAPPLSNIRTTIQRNLAIIDASKSIRFSELVTRLEDGRLKRLDDVIYFLFALAGSGVLRSSNPIMGGLVGGSARPTPNLRQNRIRSRNSKPVIVEGTKNVAVSSVCSVFNEYYKPMPTSLKEQDFVQALIYTLQSIPTPLLPYTTKYTINSTVKLPKPVATLIIKVLEISHLSKECNEMVASIKREDGLVKQALKECVQNMVSNALHQVSAIGTTSTSNNTAIKGSEGFVEGKMTLKRLYIQIHPLKRLLSIILKVLRVTKDARGGLVLTRLKHLLLTGDFESVERVKIITEKCQVPMEEMTEKWVESGQLVDPFNEFFVRRVEGGSVWNGMYVLVDELVPEGVDGSKVLMVGKSICFISLTPSTTTTASKSPSNLAIGKQYKTVTETLLNLIFEQNHLMVHLDWLKRYLLLGQGDFVSTLIDSLNVILDKPIGMVYRHDVVAGLESAIRDTGRDGDLERLDVRFEGALIGSQSQVDENSLKGWDVFKIEYLISAPIDTILDEKVMLIYQKIFTFLWRLKRVEKALKGPKESRLNRQRVVHFVDCLMRWVFEIIEVEWSLMLTQIRQAENLDEIISAHSTCLMKMAKKALFNTDLKAKILIEEVLTMILDKSKVDDMVKMLWRVLMDSEDPSLGILATRINFNDFFEE